MGIEVKTWKLRFSSNFEYETNFRERGASDLLDLTYW